MQKSSKFALILLIPASFAFLQVLYLPHFTGINRFSDFVNYLLIRSYLFLSIFCGVAIATILIISILKPTTWFPAIFGVSICCFALNIVYLWSAVPTIPLLNSILFTETEDGVIYYNSPTEIWLAIAIGILVCVIGFVQGFMSRGNLKVRLFHAFTTGGLFASLAILPLPIYIYWLDPRDLDNHVTNLFLQSFTNADLLYTLLAVLLISATFVIRRRVPASIRLTTHKLG